MNATDFIRQNTMDRMESKSPPAAADQTTKEKTGDVAYDTLQINKDPGASKDPHIRPIF